MAASQLQRPGGATRWVTIAFATALALLVAIAAVASARMAEVQALNGQRPLVRGLLLDIKNLFSALQDAETGQRGYLLTGDAAYVARYETSIAAVQHHRASIARRSLEPVLPRIDLDGLSPLIDAKLAELDETIQAQRRGDTAAALSTVRSGRGKQLMDEIRVRFGAELTDIERTMDNRVALHTQRIEHAKLALHAGQAGAVALLALAFYWLRRDHGRVEQQVAERTAELRQTVETLRSSEAFIRAIGDNLPGGTLYSLGMDENRRLRFHYVSAGVERINGLSPKALVADATLFFHHVVEEDRAGLLAERERANRPGHVFRHEARVRRPDGEVRWCLFTAAVREAADGTLRWDGIELDITEQRLATRELRVSEERLRLATEASNVGLWEWIPGSREIYFSPACKRQLGFDDQDMFDRDDAWYELVHPDDRADTVRRVKATSHPPWPPYENEYRVRHCDGTYRWFRARGAMLLDEQGQPLRLLGVIEDVTALREDQQERERLFEQHVAARAEADAAQARVALVLESVSDAFVAVDRQWRFSFVNRKAAQTFGHPSAELVGKTIWNEFPDSLVRTLGPSYRKAMAERVFVFFEAYDELHRRWYENRIYPAEDGIAVFFSDISERKRAEVALRATEQQLHELLAQSRRDQERERIRISRQIHDELGQQLTGVKMDLRWIERKLSEPGTAPALNALLDRTVAASELNDQIIATVQRIAAELRPTALDHLGLVSALRQRARDFERRSGLRCSVKVVGAEPQPAASVANELFYIVQEALINVARHAKALQVDIRIGRQGHEFVIDIRDDGVGIDPAQIEGRHSLGLLGMRERALQCGGSLQVERAQPVGTLVTVRVPVAQPTEIAS